MDKPNDIVISAPGKVILHGEHAVVYGKRAIAASLNLRTFIHVKGTSDKTVAVSLPDIGLKEKWSTETLTQHLQLPLCDPRNPVAPDKEFLKSLTNLTGIDANTAAANDLAVVAFLYLYSCLCYDQRSPCGLAVHLASALPTSAGLGSSAAFSSCLAAAFLLHRGLVKSEKSASDDSLGWWTEEDHDLINRWAFQAEKIIHGNPSGIDNSVSTFGGAIRFQGGKISPLKKVPTLRVLLFNTKTPRSTKLLVAGVRDRYNKHPSILGPVLDSIEAISETCERLFEEMCGNLTSDHFKTLQDLVDMNHSLLAAMGVSHPTLEQIRQAVSNHKLTCKLTGAGGGGCAFAFLPLDFDKSSIEAVQSEISSMGFDCWETSIGGLGVVQHHSLNGQFATPDNFGDVRL